MSPQQVTKEGFSLSQAMGASGQDKKHAACLLHAPAIPYRNLRAAEELTLCQRPRISEKNMTQNGSSGIPYALPQVSLCPRMATIAGESSQEAEHEVWKS